MLQRLLFLFVLLLIISISTNWLAQQPGEVSVDWFGWRMQLPTSLAVAFVFMFTLIVILFDRIWRFARDFPKWLTRRIKSRRDAAGHRALTLGLMAVSAGEVEAARKHASRAKRLLKSPELTGLLTAQVAHLTGDHRAAQNYFSSILGDRDTAFLGYVGLMRLELDRRDGVAALKAAKHALELNPASKMVARQLLQIEIEMRDWLAALKTLNVIRKAQKRRKKQRDKSELTLDRYEVVLNYLVSIEEINENKNYKIDRLKQALSVNPGFLPAAIELANFYIKTSEYSKATKVLETAFSFSPHENLLSKLKMAWKSNDGQSISRMEQLLPKVNKSQSFTAYKLVAAAAAEAGLDGEASRLVSEAKALSNEHNSATPTWQCISCKGLSDEWGSHCWSCGQFGSLVWCFPEKLTPLINSNI